MHKIKGLDQVDVSVAIEVDLFTRDRMGGALAIREKGNVRIDYSGFDQARTSMEAVGAFDEDETARLRMPPGGTGGRIA